MGKRPRYRPPEQIKREKELKIQWDELLARNRYRSSTPPKGQEPTLENVGTAHVLLPITTYKPLRRETPKFPSKVGRGHVPLGPSVGKPTLDPEMEMREIQAQEEIKRKRQRVAPIANKMGYQLITDPDDFKTMGRKT